MKVAMTAAVAALLATSCCDTYQFNVPCTEEGEVYDTAFVPPQEGKGSSFNFSDGSFSSQDIHIDAAYSVVFKCQHGKFVIGGSRGEALYKKLYRGQKVTIDYETKWEASWTGEGSPKFKNCHYRTNFLGMSFVDATPKASEAERTP